MPRKIGKIRSMIQGILALGGEPLTANQIHKAVGAGVTKNALNAALYAGGFAKVPDTSPPKWRVGEPGGGGAAAAPSDGCVRRPASPSAMDTKHSFDGMTVIVVGACVLSEDLLRALLGKLSKAAKVVAVGPVADQLETLSPFLDAAVEAPELESRDAAVAFAEAAVASARAASPNDDEDGAAGPAVIYTPGPHPLHICGVVMIAFDMYGVAAHEL